MLSYAFAILNPYIIYYLMDNKSVLQNPVPTLGCNRVPTELPFLYTMPVDYHTVGTVLRVLVKDLQIGHEVDILKKTMLFY